MPHEYKRRERRQVSFNTHEDDELKMLQYIDREDVNFSGLVKKLLFAYLLGKVPTVGTPRISHDIAEEAETIRDNPVEMHSDNEGKEAEETQTKPKGLGIPFS